MRRLIGELGLRYRPSAQADLEAHAGTLALLIMDLIDVPEDYLEAAINNWSGRKPFLPKACELIELAQQEMHRATARRGKVDYVQTGNDHLREIGRTDVEWFRDHNGELKIGSCEEAADSRRRRLWLASS